MRAVYRIQWRHPILQRRWKSADWEGFSRAEATQVAKQLKAAERNAAWEFRVVPAPAKKPAKSKKGGRS